MAEIEPSTLWIKGPHDPRPRGNDRELAAIAALPQAKLLHGVGYPIGGTVCDQQEHVPEFRRWAQALAPAWVSEHLSVLQLGAPEGPVSAGFLMPPVQTEATARLAAGNIAERQARLGQAFAFETGVNYFPSQPWEMEDGAFFAAVAEAAGCGILLDLNNLWVNERNGRARLDAVVAALPQERIWEVHLAGAEFAHGHWLDAHCGAVDRELLARAADIVADLPNLGAIIFEVASDRAAALGEAGFLGEVERLNELWAGAGSGRSAQVRSGRAARPASGAPTPRAWEAEIARRLGPAAEPAPDPAVERAFALYRELIASFRKGAAAELLKTTTLALLRELGEARVGELFAAYAKGRPPALYPTEEALGFAAFLRREGLAAGALGDILAFEAGVVTAIAEGGTARIVLGHDIEALLAAARDGRPLGEIAACPMTLEVSGGERPRLRRIATA